MTTAIVVKYLHYLSIFILVASVFGEFLLVKKSMQRNEIAKLAKLDLIYGISSISVVALGFTLWFGVGKTAEFYSNNPIFWLKISLAILLGILSIYPTVYFIKNRKGAQEQILETPKLVFYSIYAEMAVLTIIPLLAVLMANGVGL
jgi:putative membrane protein